MVGVDEMCIKIYLCEVIFTDDGCAILDYPHGWAKHWIIENKTVLPRPRQQRTGGGLHFVVQNQDNPMFCLTMWVVQDGTAIIRK